ncbi:MAG: ATP-grasp domain-containing protein [Promethearchaeota archaeon]|jgi:predicted ATP-grasp superfamily ATP-dependent carboligase
MGNSIFIFEFVSGGGFSKAKIPISLFCEGFGMLRSLILDFTSLDFEISTLLDSRISYLSKFIPTDRIRVVNEHDNYLKKYKESVRDTDYMFIIAPETSNILYSLTRIAKNYKKICLSSNLEAIKIGTSKFDSYNFLRRNKITTPKTFLIPLRKNKIDIDFVIQKFNSIQKPVVIKPEDGVGAESIFYFESQPQIEQFFQEQEQKIDRGRNFIIQEYIEGRDLSASVILPPSSLKDQTPILLSINSQNVNIKSPSNESEYLGGYSPIENYEELKVEFLHLLEKINFTKFKGYFGLDFMFTNDLQFNFIEINPRLTTSYIGLRKIINLNPAQIILDSYLNRWQPVEISHKGTSLFLRVDMMYTGKMKNVEFNEKVQKETVNLIPEMITPPISLNDSNKYSCFIATATEDLPSSQGRMQEIIRILEMFNLEIIK